MRIDCEETYFRNVAYPYKEYKRILYEPGVVTRIKLNRPRYLNPQSHALLGELEDAFDRASDDPECRVIVLSGEGSCYSSGDDNVGLSPEGAPCLVTDETPEELVKRFGSERRVWHEYNKEHDYFISYFLHIKLPRVPKPTIAMVHGWCIYGAYSSATAMDVVFASEDALFLGGGPTPRNLWQLGPRKVLEIGYENRFMTAREALELGLVNRVFPNYEILERETLAYAERVAREVPAALRRTKEHFWTILDSMGFRNAWDAVRIPYYQVWRNDAIEGHAMRYEGRGRARTPVGLYNLAQKLLTEGQKLPPHVLKALTRAAGRDDKGRWQEVLHQDWRSNDRVERTDASAQAWQERMEKYGFKDIKDLIKEMLASLKK